MLTAEIDKALAVIGAQRELAQLLDDIRAFLKRYLVLRDCHYDILTVWTVHTFCLDAFDFTPYINIWSATKESGKTLLLQVLSLLVCKAWLTGHTTVGALIRKIDTQQPTLLLDETDLTFAGDKDYKQKLTGILNAGHARSGIYTMCVPKGNEYTTKDFDVFGAKGYAGIGDDTLPNTVISRSIPIAMKRKRGDEHVERFREREAKERAAPLKKCIEAWVTQEIMRALRAARPKPAPGLSPRGDDVTEPLLAIADRAGEKWAKKARQAMTALLGETNHSDDDDGVQLLRDIFEPVPRDVPFISTKGLRFKLGALEERPWITWSHGNLITARALARLLKRFGIKPRSNGKVRGYYREDFLDAWRRYTDLEVDPPPEEASTRQEPNKTGVKQGNSTRQEKGRADGLESNFSPVKTETFDALTVASGGGGKVVELLPQERELQVQRVMRSAKDHDERVRNENEWTRRSKEERKKR